MKNIAIINTCDNGSTGKIALGLLNNLNRKDYNACFYYGRGKQSESCKLIKIDTDFEVLLHAFMARITGYQGSFSNHATKKLLKLFCQRNIDTVYLISIHGYYINEKMLFDYIAKNNIRLIYMMIDEYAYLGNCTNEPNCEVYQNMRGKCPDISKYPKSLFFNTCISIIQKKQQYYEKMHNTIFVGPEFLVLNSKKSYLGKFMKSKILDEAIDLTIYSPKDSSSYREHLNISADVKVILCIAPSTNPLKGGQYFVELAWRFMDLKDYVFIYIGYTSPNISDLPSNLIPIKYVEKDGDLAYYYSMADLFVNPSLADAMSNTCIEALSCGTPLLCFNISGMPYIMDNTVGTLVEAKNVDALVETVLKVEKKTPDIIRTCRKYAEVRYDNIQYAEKLIKIGLEE